MSTTEVLYFFFDSSTGELCEDSTIKESEFVAHERSLISNDPTISEQARAQVWTADLDQKIEHVVCACQVTNP